MNSPSDHGRGYTVFSMRKTLRRCRRRIAVMRHGKAEPAVYSRQSHAVSLLYRGKPYPGRTLVLTAADQPGKAYRGETWGPYLTGRWEQREVPGAHATMLREPHVAALAAALDAAIAAALTA